MLNPNTMSIQGDISRNDVKVLFELCTNKNVIEYGVGGSTLILAQIAKTLICYDTDINWINTTAKRLQNINNKTCNPELNYITQTPHELPESDIIIIDGHGDTRHEWAKHLPTTKQLLFHDSLGSTTTQPTIYHITTQLFTNMTLIENLDTAKFHYKDSNYLLIIKRETPIKYVNWNETETENRLNPYSD